MRQIVIDTETTGLEPQKGHRIIEVGCVELINRKPTGKEFHKYINPEREVEEGAIKVHNISNEFLRDKPVFSEILNDLLEFINGAELIAHNASFDVGFINHEIKLVSKKKPLLDHYVTVLDTLTLAREKFPGQRNTLDAICKRYNIDLSARKLHGALLDAQLLTKAYLLMTGGQGSLFTDNDLVSNEENKKNIVSKKTINGNKIPSSVILADDAELSTHDDFLEMMKKKSGKCLWEKH